jgi:organic hydroperoxide reductase OsmC/OhrA
MSQHLATIHWRRGHAAFVDNHYSRAHVWRFDGGAEVLASSSPLVVPPPLSNPAAVDPEEAFVASLSSCHMLWFLSLAAERGLCVERYDDDAVGVMAKNADGRMAMTRVTLRPRVAFAAGVQPTRDVQAELHVLAHEACFIAASVLAEVRCEPIHDV